jgi:hypothetical protein
VKRIFSEGDRVLTKLRQRLTYANVMSTLAVFIAMNAGFSVTLLCGAALYAVAALLVSGLG